MTSESNNRFTFTFRSDDSSAVGHAVRMKAAQYGFEWMPLPNYPLTSDAAVVLVALAGEKERFASLSEKCGVWNREERTACACHEVGLGKTPAVQEDEGESLTDWMWTEWYYYGKYEICFESSPNIPEAELGVFKSMLDEAMGVLAAEL